MRKIIILLLCCGVLVSMVGCGGNTAPLPTKSPPTTVSETIITEKTSSITAVEPTEKEKEPVPIESKDQETEPTVAATEPTITVEPTEETKPTETEGATVTNTDEAKVTPPIKETVPKVTKQESTEKSAPFNIDQWITFAKEYAVNIGLALNSTAADCWDNPIRAGAHCIYLERDIHSRLNRYAKDEDITDVWIWAESMGNDCYVIYIGYA